MRSLPCFVVGLLIISSFAAVGLSKQAGVEQYSKEKLTVINKEFFNARTIQTEIEEQTYIELRFEGTNGYLRNEGKPMMPLSRETLNLPFGSKIVDISCEVGKIQTIQLSNKVLPAPKPVPTNMQDAKAEHVMDQTVYDSDELFPNNWFDYYTGGGLNDKDEHTTFLTVRTFPMRYNPVQNTVEYAENLQVTITYEAPESSPFPATATYDLVIIAPKTFSNELQRLVNHKNKYEIKTTLKTLEDIYSEYSGADKPEQIKYFIKDAIETWNIKYVMLVGGLTSILKGTPRDDENQGTKDWYLPVRYTNLKEMGGTYDPGFISDLYYADIYDGQGNFSSWDSDKNGNSDGIYAAWTQFASKPKDYIDFYPDVYVGRLACRSLNEVQTVVTKIIAYEKYKHKTNWYDNMVGIGGDSHDDSDTTDYLEGELACDYVLENYMTEFNPVKLYASYKTTDSGHIPSPDNIIREVSAGCGFLLFEGHGNPGSWNTHWPGIYNWGDTPGGIDVTDFYKLKNDINLPICVIGGCHNSEFNVSIASTIDPNEEFMWTYGQPIGECFSWHLVRLSKGGTIASFGNTGLGYGAVGNYGDQDGDGIDLPDTLEALGGYQIRMFFKTIDEGEDILGAAWGKSTRYYLNTFPGMDDQTDAKTVEQWPLLGDPSLKMGGYQTDDRAKGKNIEIQNFFEKIFNLPILQKLLELL